ncbi:MAG: TVP38/TMEM64 family protein [Bacilli bacterium]
MMNDFFETFYDNKWLVALIGFIAIVVEAYFPPIPLAGMVTWHGYALGPVWGMVVSLSASVIGSYALYLTARYFQKYIPKHLKHENIRKWLLGRSTLTIALVYAVPFIPHIFLTVALGIVGAPIRKLFAALILGKFIMFSAFTLLGYKYDFFLEKPLYFVLFICITLGVVWIAKRYLPTS